MSDATLTPEAEAEKLLECERKRPGGRMAYLCKGDHHDSDCAASHRPAVAAALAVKDAEIERLRAMPRADGIGHAVTLRADFAAQIKYAKNDPDDRQLLDALCDIAGGQLSDAVRIIRNMLRADDGEDCAQAQAWLDRFDARTALPTQPGGK